jgi:hypothetical protein
MSKQLIGWIEIGLMQEPEQGSEYFYFDKSHNHFFSVLSSDYLLFDSTFERVSHIPSEYTEISLIELQDKLKRFSTSDSTIVAIPRLGQTIEDFPTEVNKFLAENSIDIESATLWIPESTGDGTFTMN